jgi:sarcosine oxidase, subunit gamma
VTADRGIRGADVMRRSPLADRVGDLQRASSSAVQLAEHAFQSMVNVRVNPESPAAHRMAVELGFSLPGPGATTGGGDRAALWLGPDEWLVIGPDGDMSALVALLDSAVGRDRGSVVDVSANRTTVIVSGAAARDVLEKAVTVDLHPRAFVAGRCAATTLARTQVVLWQTGNEPHLEYRLLVRGSFANYLADWLIDAAVEFHEQFSH